MKKVFDFLLLRSVLLLERWCEWRGRVIKIMGRPDTPESNNIYLVRYFLLPEGSPWQIYIHRFLRGDVDAPHDHPFDFLSFILTKGYTEEIHEQDVETGLYNVRYQENKPGDVVLRQASHVHKVMSDAKFFWHNRREAPLTLIIRSPRYRDWGFLPATEVKVEGTRRKWIKWSEYLGLTEDEVNKEAI